MSDMDDECSSTKAEIVINEVLSYIQYYIHKSTRENIRNVLIRFFNAETIINAKTLLWEKCQGILGPIDVRRSSNIRTAKEADVTDLINGFDKINKSPFDVPVFVAVDFENLPRFPPEDIEHMSILDRLSKIEQRMSMVECTSVNNSDSLSAMQTIVQQGLLDIDKKTTNTTASSYSEVVKNPSKFNALSVVKDNQSELVSIMWDVSEVSQKCLTEPVHEQRNLTRRPRSNQTMGRPTGMAVDPKVAPPEGTKSQDHDADHGFQLSSYETRKQHRDQRRRTAVYGTRKHATIVGGPKCVDLFVFNVDKKVEEDSIKDFLVQEENISVVNVECVSHINSYMKSFKIRVDQMYEAKLMDAEFWPEGIGC